MPTGQEHLDELSQEQFAMHHKIKTDAYYESSRILSNIALGSFGVSVAFLAFLKSPIQVWWAILISWASFLLSLIFLLLAHEANGNGSLRQQHLISVWRAYAGNPQGEWARSIDKNMNTKGDKEVRELDAKYRNYLLASKILSGAGVLFLLFFAAINLAHHQYNSWPDQAPYWPSY